MRQCHEGYQRWTTRSVCVLSAKCDLVQHGEQMSHQGARRDFESVPRLMRLRAPAHIGLYTNIPQPNSYISITTSVYVTRHVSVCVSTSLPHTMYMCMCVHVYVFCVCNDVYITLLSINSQFLMHSVKVVFQ